MWADPLLVLSRIIPASPLRKISAAQRTPRVYRQVTRPGLSISRTEPHHPRCKRRLVFGRGCSFREGYSPTAARTLGGRRFFVRILILLELAVAVRALHIDIGAQVIEIHPLLLSSASRRTSSPGKVDIRNPDVLPQVWGIHVSLNLSFEAP